MMAESHDAGLLTDGVINTQRCQDTVGAPVVMIANGDLIGQEDVSFIFSLWCEL